VRSPGLEDHRPPTRVTSEPGVTEIGHP
jgi:hypothetical protein